MNETISFVQISLPNVQKVNQPPEIMRCQTENNLTKWSDLQTAEVMEGNQELPQNIEELQVLIQELRQQSQEMGIALEITQLERQHYQNLFDCAPHAYLVTDLTGVIQEANHAAATLLCVEQNYLMGKPLVLFVLEQDRDNFLIQLQNVQHKKNWEICLQPQGSVSFPATVRYTAISNPQSNPVDWRCLLFEVSPRQPAEGALYSQESKNLGDGVFEAAKQLLPFNQLLQQEITQRQQAQESLRQKEKLYRQLVETQIDLIIRIDLQGRIGFANTVTCQALGKQLHELLGQSICEFFHTNDFPQIKEDISSLISAPHDKITNEYRLLTVNGVRWLQWNITPIVNEGGEVLELQGVGRDITQRKRAEEKITEQAALLDIVTDAILVLDLQGKILFCNQGAEQMYGWHTQEILGKDLRDMFNNIKLQLETSLGSVIASGSWHGELSKFTKSGQEIVVASRWTLMYDPAGEAKSILAVDTDITQKKQLEEKFFRAQRLESLGTLASGIAHDLNNILTPILAASQLLQIRYAQDGENYQQLLAIIEGNSKRGAALVKQVLSFARGFKGERTIVQLRHLISEVTYIAKQTFPKSIQFAITISEDLWAVCADATQLHQVLMNLVVNARDAIMPAGGTLTISTRNMFIDQAYAHMNLDAKVGDYVVVTVADTGTGIAPEILQKIFDPFFTTKDIGKGTGLGLSTVLGIIKNHGGFINVSSTLGQGTEFQLFLPAVEVPQSFDINNLDIFPGQGELILFVDDEAQIREIAKIVLEKYNYKILTASNGIEAIALYAQYSQDIRAVFMDIVMPEMDGNTAIRTLQKMDPKVKIIACSGVDPKVSLANPGHADADLVLSKPYTGQDLLNSLHYILHKK